MTRLRILGSGFRPIQEAAKAALGGLPLAECGAYIISDLAMRAYGLIRWRIFM